MAGTRVDWTSTGFLPSQCQEEWQLPQDTKHLPAACIVDYLHHSTSGILLTWCLLTVLTVSNTFQAGLCIKAQYNSEDPQASTSPGLIHVLNHICLGTAWTVKRVREEFGSLQLLNYLVCLNLMHFFLYGVQ